MNKPIKWSSYAQNDLAHLLEYLEAKWNKKSCITFLNKLDFCIELIEKNPNLFPVFNKTLGIRKCVITKQNTLFYKIAATKIEVLRLYDTRQDDTTLKF